MKMAVRDAGPRTCNGAGKTLGYIDPEAAQTCKLQQWAVNIGF